MSDYLRACSLSEVPEESALRVELDGLDVAVVRSEGAVYAVDDTCSHAQVSLSEGDVAHGEVECWLHGSRFDLATGRPTCLPATRPVATYPVKIDGDDILVDVDDPLNAAEL